MNIQQATKLIEYVVESGKRISSKAGQIEDIGVKKQYLTDEDIAIERGIKQIVTNISGNTSFYAEEEHDTFVDDESVWVCDPISGTKLFIQGLPHYAIVASHLTKGIVDFAVVYDPSSNDLFTADREAGAFLNGKQLTKKTENRNRIVFAPTSYGSVSQETIDRVKSELEKTFEVFPSQGSFALNYCLVASGEFDGVVGISKDSYPEFAGCFIANMAGYKATNIRGMKDIVPNDRQFVCGNDVNYDTLLKALTSVVNV
jgi:myo-inositol-1(or 4)-monophosphatase